ncbi:MAG: MOSC domain-containing protein [Saprospiraceae bacterium]
MVNVKELINTMPQIGKVEWIGLRPKHKAPVETVDEVMVTVEGGLEGDHYSKSGGNRQVTLLQSEHLAAMASILQLDTIDPALMRRNIVVSGINLQAFADRQFQIGEVILEMTGICHPCSRVEQNLVPGAYNAMRGHGGVTAKVIQGGTIRVGDAVQLYNPEKQIITSANHQLSIL